jgi:hypothetical protein
LLIELFIAGNSIGTALHRRIGAGVNLGARCEHFALFGRGNHFVDRGNDII